MNTLHFIVASLFGLPVQSAQLETIWHGIVSIAQSRFPPFPEQLFSKPFL